jgi:hypothetical protein
MQIAFIKEGSAAPSFAIAFASLLLGIFK